MFDRYHAERKPMQDRNKPKQRRQWPYFRSINSLKRFLRLSTFLIFSFTIASLFIIGGARARTEEALLSLGPDIIRFAKATRQDAPRSIYVNGQKVGLSVGSTSESFASVVEEFEKRCRRRSGALRKYVQRDISERANSHIRKKLQSFLETKSLDATLVTKSTKKAVVACLDMGNRALSPAELGERAAKFADTGNLEAIGSLRYFYVERGANRTVFTSLWTEDRLNLFEMFPSEGDAPGVDIDGVLRPHHTRRVLSAAERGDPRQLAIYVHSKQTEQTLFRFYKKSLTREGWTLLSGSSKKRKLRGPNLHISPLIAERRGRMILIYIAKDAEGGVFSSIIQMHGQRRQS